MTQPEPQAVDEMFNRVLHTEDDVLAAARQSAVTAGMPAIEVSAQHGKLLSLLATISGATRVLEIGTLAGYSTINLARGIGAEHAQALAGEVELAAKVAAPGGTRVPAPGLARPALVQPAFLPIMAQHVGGQRLVVGALQVPP